MAKKTKAEVDPVIDGAVNEVRDRVAKRERELTADVGALYIGLFGTYNDQVSAYFTKNFGKNTPPATEDEKSPPPVWDPVLAKKRKVVDEFTSSFADLSDAADTEAADMFKDSLPDAYSEGFNTQLWMLHQLGVDVLSDPPDAPDKKKISPLMVAAGFGGISYLARLSTWGDVFTSKVKGVLDVNTKTGGTLADTEAGLDLVLKQYQKSVQALAGNELQRVFSMGSDAALEQFRSKIDGEVWVTRRDKLVCPICAELEGRITNLQPVDDSHPGCRCRKVPTKIDSEGRAVEYLAFLDYLSAAQGN